VRLSGHSLSLRFSNEAQREERSCTGECPCGWTESGNNREVVRAEYRYHLIRIEARAEVARAFGDAGR